jgi:hypothetical protein
LAAITVQMELNTQGLLTVEQVQRDLKQILGKQLVIIDIDTKPGETDYPILIANMLVELEMRDNPRETAALFQKLHRLYDHLDGTIHIVCGEYSGVAGRRSFNKDTGGQLFL